MQSQPDSSKPGVQQLEDRNLMAAQLSASLSGGLLRIEGTNEDDLIVLRQIEDEISVDFTNIDTADGAQSSIAASEVERIEVRGLGGDDRIWLNSGDLDGQQEIDIPATVWAGTGDDSVWGNQGENTIYGQAGHDSLHGGGGDDQVFGEDGNDRVEGGSGNDIVDGGTGDDFVKGGTGDDQITGGTGSNQVFGNDGTDTIVSESKTERIDGGHGQDTAILSYHSDDDDNETAIYGTERIQEPTAAPVTRAETPVEETPNEPEVTISPVEETPVTPEVTASPVVEEPVVEATANPDVTVTGEHSTEVTQIFDLLNQHRAGEGLSELSLNEQLMEAAQYQAEYMARTEHYSHINLDGRTLSDRVEASGYSYWWVAENAHKYDPVNRRTFGLNRAYSEEELAVYFMDGWKSSDSHNGSMLSARAEEVGIAIARSESGNIYAVQVFGDPR